MATPSLEALVNDLIDQRLRQMQTAYPAEVVSYDPSNSTVTVKPLFIEAWRGPNDERVVEDIENEADTHVENVIVAFPRSGSFRIAWPINPGDTGFVIVAKYSLDRFRDQGGQQDPGDLRKFTMSGSVFFPVNVTPDSEKLNAAEGEVDNTTVITVGDGSDTDFLCWYTEMNTNLTDIKDGLDNHTHDFLYTGAGTSSSTQLGSTKASTDAGYTVTNPSNAKVKVS